MVGSAVFDLLLRAELPAERDLRQVVELVGLRRAPAAR